MARTTKKSTKVGQVAQVKKEEVMASIKDLTPKVLTTRLSEVQLEVNSQLSEINAKLLDQMGLLDNLNKAISLKQQELKELYSLEDIAVAAATLEDTINSTRENWTKEKQQWEAERLEAFNEAEKARTRKQQEWEYTFQQTSKQREQKLTDELAERNKTFSIQMEKLTKQMDERQAALQAAEKELATLRESANTLEARIAKEVAKEIAIKEATLKKNLEFEKQLLERDKQSAVTLAEQKARSAQEDVNLLQHQLQQAHATIEKLREDNKAISQAGFQALAGQQALAAVQTARQAETPAVSNKQSR